MIKFVEKTGRQKASDGVEENRFEQIREAAAEMHRKTDTDGTKRRARQTAEDNKII